MWTIFKLVHDISYVDFYTPPHNYGGYYVFPPSSPSEDTNEYLDGFIWRTVSMYLNGIYSENTYKSWIVWLKIDLFGL